MIDHGHLFRLKPRWTALGLAPIRLNAVLLRGINGINGMEAMRLIDFSIGERLELRFMGNC